MVETPPFPEKSLREAIRNAMMHNDYGSGIPIQIRIWEDRMRIADNGGIPYNWTEEDLLEDHESVPVNPSLANVFFLAGFVEGWGRGIQRIMYGYSDHPDKAPHVQGQPPVVHRNPEERQLRPLERCSGRCACCQKRLGIPLRFLDHLEGRSSREIATFLDVASTNVATRKVKPFIERGLVERTIPDAVRGIWAATST